jgi:hypothetical protein
MSKVLKIVAVVASIAAAAVTAGASLGISAALLSGIGVAASVGAGLLAGKIKAPKPSPADRDRLLASINPRAPRTIVFGTTAMATDIRDQEFTGANQEYLHRFIVVASHKVNAISNIYFDDKLAWTIGGGVQAGFTGYLTVAPILEGGAGNAINISARMGSTRRYTGLAYVHLRFKLTGNSKKAESPFASAVPSRITIEGNGIAVYDPRQDSTVPGGSGAHRADDQTTWTWGTHARNPALQALTYLLGWKINGLLAVGKGIPPRRFDFESFITAANVCDESISLAGGGTEPRYRGDGVFSEADDMSLVLNQFAATMDARFYDPQGRIAVKCMVNDLGSPVCSFTAADILGDVQWTPFGDLAENYNLVRGTYTDPSTNSLYQSVDYPEQYVASADGIDRILTLDLPLVQSPSQAQRLARRALGRAQYGGGTLSCEMQATAWRAEQFAPVELTFAPLGMDGKIFRVEEIETRVDGTVPIVLSVEDERIYDWDAEDVDPVEAVASTPYDPANNPFNLGIVETSIGTAIAGSYTSGLSGNITQVDNGAGAVTVTVPTHTRVYPAPYPSVSVTGDDLTFDYEEFGMIYYDDPTLAGGAVTYGVTAIAADAYFSTSNPYRHFIGYVTAIDSGGAGGAAGGSSPPGGGGWSGGGGDYVP